jgi:intracellular multiplication protein IcmK
MTGRQYTYFGLAAMLTGALAVFPVCAPANAQEEVAAQPPAESQGLMDALEEASPLPQEEVMEEAQTSLPDVDAVVREGSDLEEMSANVDVGPALNASSGSRLGQQSIRNEAYDAAINGLFPLQPDQIRQLLEYYDETKKAAEEPIKALPEPEVVVQTISLDPGVRPPTIDVAVGHVTTLNILDITGAPWPVHDVSWAGDFEVVEPQEGGHMIRITPMAAHAYGNLSIRLLTLKTPITFSLRTSDERVHYRMDARIPEYGPHAEASLIQGGSELSAGSPVMTSVLDGALPQDVERLDVSGVDGRTSAYRMNGQLFVRTPLSLLSPGWQSSVSSADGMNVYSLNDTPVILLSDKGKFMRATLSEKKDIFDE